MNHRFNDNADNYLHMQTKRWEKMKNYFIDTSTFPQRKKDNIDKAKLFETTTGPYVIKLIFFIDSEIDLNFRTKYSSWNNAQYLQWQYACVALTS